mmetsp:Transcript_97502/g.257460  ORF Transcript_97502/g.257460 Transcript_97502/m.257460 type:complete len:310 (+) Transcript_97502:442-1371(+)
MVLLLECHLVHFHVLGVDQVLHRLVPLRSLLRLSTVVRLHLVEKLQILGGVAQGIPDCTLVERHSQCLLALGVQVAERRPQIVSVLERALRAGAEVRVQRVERYEKHAEICLRLEDVAHHLGSGAAQAQDKLVEVLKPRLLQQPLHDLQILLAEDAALVEALLRVLLVRVLFCQELLKVRSDRSVLQEYPVDVVEATLRVEGVRHDHVHGSLVECADRVDLVLEVLRGLVVQGALNEHDDVVDHLLPRDEVQERRQRLDGLSPDIPELIRELLVALLGDRRHEKGRWFVLEEVPIIGLLQGAPQVFKGV